MSANQQSETEKELVYTKKLNARLHQSCKKMLGFFSRSEIATIIAEQFAVGGPDEVNAIVDDAAEIIDVCDGKLTFTEPAGLLCATSCDDDPCFRYALLKLQGATISRLLKHKATALQLATHKQFYCAAYFDHTVMFGCDPRHDRQPLNFTKWQHECLEQEWYWVPHDVEFVTPRTADTCCLRVKEDGVMWTGYDGACKQFETLTISWEDLKNMLRGHNEFRLLTDIDA